MAMDVDVRPYTSAGDDALTHLHSARRLREAAQQGGRGWVAWMGDEPVGYLTATPVPGLAGVLDLYAYVVPGLRRRGIGSQLLQEAVDGLAAAGARQLSHGVESLGGPAARFLRRHNFYVEHEEWRMERPDLEDLPPLSLPPGCCQQTYERVQANARFRALYDRSFRATRWYQPYAEADVEAELDDAADILFLICRGEAVGFAWTRLRSSASGRVGEIEPIGVVDGVQGRGYGRALLVSALHRLAQRGAQRARLGVWRENAPALNLYRWAGFRRIGSLYYLAYDLA